MTAIEIARVANDAGFRGVDLTTAVAVVLAESSGNARAHALTSREDSRGWFQINVWAHPEFASVDLYDPTANARAAFAIWQKSGWGPWSTHNTGAYLLYWPTAQVAVAALGAQKIGNDPSGTAAAAVGALGEAASQLPGGAAVETGVGVLVKAGAWIGDRGNWVRVGQVVIGGALVVTAVGVLARPLAAPVMDALGPVAKLAATKGGKG